MGCAASRTADKGVTLGGRSIFSEHVDSAFQDSSCMKLGRVLMSSAWSLNKTDSLGGSLFEVNSRYLVFGSGYPLGESRDGGDP